MLGVKIERKEEGPPFRQGRKKKYEVCHDQCDGTSLKGPVGPPLGDRLSHSGR